MVRSKTQDTIIELMTECHGQIHPVEDLTMGQDAFAIKSAGKPLRHNMAMVPKPLPPPPPPKPRGCILLERHIPCDAVQEGLCAPNGWCLTFSFMASIPTRSIGMFINS